MDGSRTDPGAVQHPEPGDVRAEIPGGWAVASILRLSRVTTCVIRLPVSAAPLEVPRCSPFRADALCRARFLARSKRGTHDLRPLGKWAGAALAQFSTLLRCSLITAAISLTFAPLECPSIPRTRCADSVVVTSAQFGLGVFHHRDQSGAHLLRRADRLGERQTDGTWSLRSHRRHIEAIPIDARHAGGGDLGRF